MPELAKIHIHNGRITAIKDEGFVTSVPANACLVNLYQGDGRTVLEFSVFDENFRFVCDVTDEDAAMIRRYLTGEPITLEEEPGVYREKVYDSQGNHVGWTERQVSPKSDMSCVSSMKMVNPRGSDAICEGKIRPRSLAASEPTVD